MVLIVDEIEQKRLPLTFSLTMLRERIQRLLNFCSPAAVPTEWNVQLEVESEVFNGLRVWHISGDCTILDR